MVQPKKMIEQRYYYIYIFIIIIQHLYNGIGVNIIRKPIHKAIDKQNSWTSTKSTKDIKIINNITSRQYGDILGQGYGYQILAAHHDYTMNHYSSKTRKKNERSGLCSRIRYCSS